MNLELLEYVKFLHLHNLVDIISIIESIPIYYQTQIKKYGSSSIGSSSDYAQKHDKEENIEYIKVQKLRLQNLTYIAQNIFNLKFPPDFKIEYQTWRMGPYSLDLENECNNLIYSDVFNNAISSKKTIAKRYNITDYDKKTIIRMFKHVNNYRRFLGLVNDKDIKYLKDISTITFFHNFYINNMYAPPHRHRYYVRSFANKYKLLRFSLLGIISNKKDLENYISELIDVYFSLLNTINRRRRQSSECPQSGCRV